MGATEQIMKNILAEIERDGVDYEAGRVKGKVEQQLEDYTLGSSMEAIPDCPVIKHDLNYDFRENDMVQSRNASNLIHHVEYNQPNNSGNVLKRLLKKVIRRIIAPVMEPIILEQNKFNAAAATSINRGTDTSVELVKFAHDQQCLNREQEQLNEEIRLLRREVELLRQENVEARMEVISSRKRLHREITLLTEAIKAEYDSAYTGIDYADFENHFRGSETDIKERQSIYLKYFKEKGLVLDLGCGRGEFLEVMKEQDIAAIGVDQYMPFVEVCRNKGLEAVEADAVGYVEKQEDNSLGGIFAAQLAEHLTMERLVNLCKEAYKKLSPGACLVMETPNPTCLAIYSHAFYMDPSHKRPVHPLTLEYILTKAGFEKIEIIYPESSTWGYRLPLVKGSDCSNAEEFNEGINRMSDMLFGAQDYAIVAYK